MDPLLASSFNRQRPRLLSYTLNSFKVSSRQAASFSLGRLCDFARCGAEVSIFFLLDDFHIQPYSLRRGGATSPFRLGVTFDQLLVRGRWSNQRTARIYLDDALQQSSLLQFSLPSRHRLAWAQQHLPFDRRTRHDGTRGWAGGRGFPL